MQCEIFEELLINTDVLSIAYHSGYILAGIGSSLFVYKDNILKSQRRIFYGERIHNIITQNDDILVKGCREIVLGYLQSDSMKLKFYISHLIKCNDWIMDAFLDKSNKCLVLATAHNVIEVWDINKEKFLQKLVCEEKCILYSCKFLGNSAEDFIIFCGTVFSEIIIWAPEVGVDKDHKVMHRLVGHDGVIFSVVVDVNQKFICSTSDDRSVRIWKVNIEDLVVKRENWKNAEITLMYSLYGHTARVWKSLILSNYVVSVGEDSKLCIWNMNGKLENTLQLHQESGIRGLCYDAENEAIITGGEDGAICIFPTDRLRSQELSDKQCFDLKLLGLGLPRKVKFLQEVFCITDKGALLILTGNIWFKIYENKNFSNYCILESSSCQKYIFLGAINGEVVIIDVTSKKVVFDESLVDGKIYSAHWLGANIIMCMENGVIIIFKVTKGCAKLEKAVSLSLPSCKERWTTCALMCENLLICGDRMGGLHVFGVYSGEKNPRQSFVKIHGHLGVCDIIQNEKLIMTAGRDGSIKQFQILDGKLTYLMSYKLPMEWPWKMVRFKNDILVLGFSSVNFISWSLKNREIVARLDCGGGHRSFAYRLLDNRLKLLYIRDKKIFLKGISVFAPIQIRPGFHGKEINALKILQKNPLILISGSEDTTLRLTHVARDVAQELYVIDNHISSVRDICIFSISETEKMFISCGGRAQISVHKLLLGDMKYQIVQNFFLCNEKKDGEPSPEGETRIMCVDAMKKENGLLVCAACSDRHIRLFNFTDCLKCVASIPYSHCILKVTFIEGESGFWLVSMATDGYIVFWKILLEGDLVYEKVGSVRVHQSGINSFEFVDFGNGRWLMITGGDDNLLSAVLLGVDDYSTEKIHVLQEWKNSNTHSCQITGIKLIGNILLTTSIDQRLTIWQCRFDENSISLVFKRQYISPVADIQGIDAFSKTVNAIVVILYGKGIDVIEVDTSQFGELTD